MNFKGVPVYKVSKFKSKEFDYALVIPVLNENGRLIEQLKSISILKPRIDVIIADGGSNDGSTEEKVLKQLNVSVLLLKRSEGQLSAQLRMAFHYCLEMNYQGVITMDGNNKDGAEGINTILKSLENGYDFVQGSRFRKGGRSLNTPILRYISIRLIHAPLTSLGSGRWFTDTTNGFRGYSKELIKSKKVGVFREIFQSYELLAYLPIAAGKHGFRTTEVGVSRSYPKNENPPTKISGFKGWIHLMIILIKSLIGSYKN